MWNKETITEFWKHNESSFAGDTNAKEIYRLSKKYIKGNILDIGAGSGKLLELLGSNAVGIDLVPRHKKVSEGSIENLHCFAYRIFSMIFCIDVLEHVPNEIMNQGKAEIARVLKPKGKLIIVVPNQEYLPDNYVYCPNCKVQFHRWGHLRRYNKDIIKLYWNDCNFRVIKCQALPISLMAQNWVIRYFWWLFVWLKWIKRSELFVVVERI